MIRTSILRGSLEIHTRRNTDIHMYNRCVYTCAESASYSKSQTAILWWNDITVDLFSFFFAKKGALCIVKATEHAYIYIYNLIIYNKNINILFADYWVYIHILIYWIIYFILFYRFMILYICYSLFTYTPRNIILQYATHARFIYWQVGFELCWTAPAGLPPWLRDHAPINFSFFFLCLFFFFLKLFVHLFITFTRHVRRRTVWRRCASRTSINDDRRMFRAC